MRVPPAAKSVFTSAQRVALLAGFALLIALRLPQAWVHGRFLDEEATVFLAYAWHHPWADALFRAFGGYINFAANATTLLTARLVQDGLLPLERAPYLTMLTALAFQLVPGILILTGRADWLGDRRAVLAALLLIAVAPASEEVFFNVLHIQFHLALAAALILALDAPQGRARFGYYAILFAAPLCGPGAIAILPLFAARAVLDRDPQRWGQFALFAAGAAVQLIGFFGASPLRGNMVDPATAAAVLFVRLIALPLLNYGSADAIGAAVLRSQAAGGIGWWAAAGLAVVLLGALFFVAARRRDAAVWLVAAALGVAGASFGFGMVLVDRANMFTVGAGERYNFLPLVLLGMALIALAMRRSPGWRVYVGLCGLMLLTAAIRYPSPLTDFSQGPSWPAEVAKWRQDHRHRLAVWPEPWAADLSGEVRPCTPVGSDLAASMDPRYCESGWAADFLRPQRLAVR